MVLLVAKHTGSQQDSFSHLYPKEWKAEGSFLKKKKERRRADPKKKDPSGTLLRQ
jgi:hypothetical protein